jgi:hypothetical protein
MMAASATVMLCEGKGQEDVFREKMTSTAKAGILDCRPEGLLHP